MDPFVCVIAPKKSHVDCQAVQLLLGIPQIHQDPEVQKLIGELYAGKPLEMHAWSPGVAALAAGQRRQGDSPVLQGKHQTCAGSLILSQAVVRTLPRKCVCACAF